MDFLNMMLTNNTELMGIMGQMGQFEAISNQVQAAIESAASGNTRFSFFINGYVCHFKLTIFSIKERNFMT